MSTIDNKNLGQMNVPIIKAPFNEDQARKIIEKFDGADEIQKGIKLSLRDYAYKFPVPVFVLAQPDLALTGWLQGIGVFNNEICAMITYTSDFQSPVFFCLYSSILYMRTRTTEDINKIVLIDNMLNEFASSKI